MPKLQKTLMLTDKGYKDLKKAIFACTLTNFSLMLPFGISIQIITEILKPLSGGEVSNTKLWFLFILGVFSAFIVFLCNKNDYKKTYVVSYLESESTRVAIAEHIRKLPMSLFNSKNLTELTTNFMGDVATSEHVLSHVIPQIIANFISVTVICTLLTIYDPRMSLAVFIFVPLAFSIILISRKFYGKLHKKHSSAKLAASEQVQEYIEGIKVIRACNMEGEKFSSLEKALSLMKKFAIKMEFGTGVFVGASQMVLQAGIGTTVLLGAMLLSKGQIELIPMTIFLLIVVKIYGPFIVELTLLPELFYHQIAVGRMRTLMSIEPMTGSETKLTNNNICLSNVSFSYNKNSENAINNLSLSIPEGTVTALVGPSGSGKSTVSRLIARFWDVDEGKITIGGVDIKTLDPEHLMSYMSFVFQDVVLFNDTVINNIRIGNMNASGEEIIAAAKAACCDSFVSRMSEGYNTLLGENGATLSGGERQRISIARALLKNAPIILLDEATASLDPENEDLIQQAISALIKGKTVIVIAHRLKTIMGVDKIVVFDKGKLIEEGTSEELLLKNGLFARLYSVWKEGSNWGV